MFRSLLILILLASTALLPGCATEPEPDRPQVRLGMSRDDLRFFFGEPLRVERTDSGEEYWFYRCAASIPPQVDGAVWGNPREQAAAVSVTVPTTSEKPEVFIHLSADGHVVDPLPEARITGR